MTEREMFLYLTGAGLTPEGAAGVMGNLQAESGLNPKNLQNSYERRLGVTDDEYTAAVDTGRYYNFIYDGAGYGLAQWTFWSRKQGLLSMARQRGTSIGDPDTQLAYLLTELSAYGELWGVLKTTTDIDKASDLVLIRYERPADMGEKTKLTRRKYAREIYARCMIISPASPEPEPAGVQRPDTPVPGADSPLVSVAIWSDKHSGKRKEPISKITIHHMAVKTSAETCMKYHVKTAHLKSSAQYYIGNDGLIGQSVPEACRAWTSSSDWNDQRAVTIEVSNSKTAEPWPISGAAYRALIALCVDICRRNGISSVHYTGDRDGSLTEHRMFSSTACPGTTIHELLKNRQIENDINAELSGIPDTTFRVRVSISDLNIRRGPGTGFDIAGICPPGVYTITARSPGKGSTTGWGRLKSGAGWISLDFAERLP